MLAFLVWALVAAGTVAWGLKLFAQPLPLPPQAALAGGAQGAAGDWARVFGRAPPDEAQQAAAPAPAADDRFRLLGVVASRGAPEGAAGVALIAVDGKSPRALRVGAVVDGDWVLQAVRPRGVAIGPRGAAAALQLELPALAPPAVGVPGLAAAAPPRIAPPSMPGLPARPFDGPMPASEPVVQEVQQAAPPLDARALQR